MQGASWASRASLHVQSSVLRAVLPSRACVGGRAGKGRRVAPHRLQQGGFPPFGAIFKRSFS